MKSSSVERDDFQFNTLLFNGPLRNHHWPLHCDTFQWFKTLCQNNRQLAGCSHRKHFFHFIHRFPFSCFIYPLKLLDKLPDKHIWPLHHTAFSGFFTWMLLFTTLSDTDNLESSQRKRYCIPMHFPLFFWVNMHLMDVLDHCAHIQHFRSILRMPQYTIKVLLLRLKALTSFFFFFS